MHGLLWVALLCEEDALELAHAQQYSALLLTIRFMLSQKGSVNGLRVQHEDIAGVLLDGVAYQLPLAPKIMPSQGADLNHSLPYKGPTICSRSRIAPGVDNHSL